MEKPDISDSFPAILVLLGLSFNWWTFFFESIWIFTLILYPIIWLILFLPFLGLTIYGLISYNKKPKLFKVSLVMVTLTIVLNAFSINGVW